MVLAGTPRSQKRDRGHPLKVRKSQFDYSTAKRSGEISVWMLFPGNAFLAGSRDDGTQLN
jgi:hypothetical protein